MTAAQVEQLAAQFSRTWMRPPTEEELAGLIERHIRGEVFYREALAMGLDQDDPYVRNRLGQKLEFLLDDLSAETAPSDETLARYLQEHGERYQVPARVSFQQVYLNPDRHPQLEADATRLLAQLRGGADPATLGGDGADDLRSALLEERWDDAVAAREVEEWDEIALPELVEAPVRLLLETYRVHARQRAGLERGWQGPLPECGHRHHPRSRSAPCPRAARP